MSDDHEIMTSLLDWFMEIEQWIPGAHSMVGEIILGPIPLSDANNVYDLADQWGRLAESLNAAYEDVAKAANPILDNWSGDGASARFIEQWFAYLEGLRQTAESAAQMQRGVQNFGLEVELMKFMALLNLIMLAVSLFMLIAAAIPSGGGSLAAAPGLFTTCRIAIGQAASQTVGKISSIAMQFVMRNLTRLFGRLPAAIATRVVPAAVRAAVPRITSIVTTRVATAATQAMTRTVIGRGARAIAARGISKAVANRMAAQALRGLARTGVHGTLASQTNRAVQRQLAKEIQQQLLRRWAGKAVTEAAENELTRLAQQQVARSLGREFAGYVGVRVAFGAGFMGGGNLLGQFGQVVSGNRTEGVDWGQVGMGTLQGAAFGAGMFGGPLGHAVGGAVTGGGFALGQEVYDHAKTGDKIDWGAVGHGAVQGAAMGVIFGGQTHLENANLGGGRLRIGTDVHVLPGENGGFNVVSARAKNNEALLLTSDGYVGWQGRDGTGSIPEALAQRPDAVSAMDQHWPGRTGESSVGDPAPPAPPAAARPDTPAAGRADAGAPARAGDGGGGGGGPRQNVPGGTTTRSADPVRVGDGAGPQTIERVRVPAGDSPPVHEPGTPTTGRPGADGPVPDTTRAAGDPPRVDDPPPGRSDGAGSGRSDGGGPGRADGSGPADGGAPARAESGVRTPGAPETGDRVAGDGPPAVGDRLPSSDPPGSGDRSAGDRSPGERASAEAPADRRGGDSPMGDRVPPGGDRTAPGGDRVAPVRDGAVPGGDRIAPGGDRAGPGVDRTAPGGDRVGSGRERDGLDPAPHGRAETLGVRGDADGPAGRPDGPVRDGDGVPRPRDADGPARPEQAGRDGDAAPPRHDDGPPPRDPDAAPPADRAAPHGDEVPPAARGNETSTAARGTETAPRGDQTAPRGDETPLASAGAVHGEPPTPRSIEQGTVRMEDHPNFPRLVAELSDLGFAVLPSTAGHPHTVVRHVIDGKSFEVVRVEREVRVVEGMRYLDFEHEVGHVRQVTDPARFPDGPPATEAVRERPGNTPKEVKNAPGVMKASHDVIAEYHVRLEEYIRLSERGVDAPILAEHADGVDFHRHRYRDLMGNPRKSSDHAWSREHFPDIPALERRYEALRAADESNPAAPAPRSDPADSGDGTPLSKHDTPESDGETAAVHHDGESPNSSERSRPGARPSFDSEQTGPGDRMASGGHERGVDPSPRSIEQGTVRFREHPDFPEIELELRDLGVTFHASTENYPHVVYRHVFDANGQTLLRVEKEMHVFDDMRFIDFEHEVGHVHQMESRERFPDGPPSTDHPRREMDDGALKKANNKSRIGERMYIVEYHVRLEEVIRLIERGVDRPIVQEHLQGLAERELEYREGVLSKPRSKHAAWAREHFSDIPDLRRRVDELRAEFDAEWSSPTSGRETARKESSSLDLDQGMTKRDIGREGRDIDGDSDRLLQDQGRRDASGVPVRVHGDDGPHAGDRQGDPGRQSGGRDGGQDVRGRAVEDSAVSAAGAGVADPGVVRGVEPSRLVDVPGRVPDHPVAAPHEVAAVLNNEMSALVEGRAPDGAQRPHRADWDAESGIMRVRYGDGLEVDVVVQVNESVPPGRSVVVRPPMEVVDGVWRQTGAAGVVLSPHVPADPVARAAHVHEALESGWRTLHGEVADQLHSPGSRADGPDVAPDGGPPRDVLPPEALRALEDPVRPDVPVRDADSVARHQATPADLPAPPPLTPDSVRQTLTGRGVPEQLTRWAGEHLANRADNGTLRPKPADEIAATVRDLADQAVDLVTPRPEAVGPGSTRLDAVDPAATRLDPVDPAAPRIDPVESAVNRGDQVDPAVTRGDLVDSTTARAEGMDGPRHTASRIDDTAFVPDGRAPHHQDVTVQELHNASLRVGAHDFADGTVAFVTPDGPLVRVEMADGTVQNFAARIGSGMDHLAETTVRTGTPDDPHIVRVNNRVAADQLSRVWVHEITETLAMRHAEQTRPQPQGLVRRAMAAIGRIFGGGEPSAPPRVDPHVAARLNERLHLQRQLDWSLARPEDQARLRLEIAGIDRDLVALGHRVESPSRFFEQPRPALPDGVIGGRHPASHDSGPLHDSARPADPARQEPVFRDPDPPEPAPEPRPESSHDAHWTDRPWEREGRRPSLDELIPVTEAEAVRWSADVQAEIAKLIETRDFAGFRVRFDEHNPYAVTVNRNSVTVRLKIYDADGVYAGHTNRVFYREHDGTLFVTHSSIQLQPHAQGRGFANEWNSFLIDWYRYSGVDYVEVHAVNRGAYAWARDGYDWAPNTEHRSSAVLDRLRAGIRSIDEHLDQVAQWQRGERALDVDPLLRRYGVDHPDQLADRMQLERDAAQDIVDRARRHPFGSADYPTPQEIARAGSAGRHGRDEVWVGKEALLGSDWKGVRPITDGVVRHPRVEPPAPHAPHDLFSHESDRTNADVLQNGSDVPFTYDAVAHVAELMGINLDGIRVRLISDASGIGYLDHRGAAAVTPVEAGGREIRLGPAAFADAETLAATVAHEYTHVQQLSQGREVSTHTLRALEDEAFASEGPALARFREGFEGWEHVRSGAVLDRESLRPAGPGRSSGVGSGARGSDFDRGDVAGRGDRGGGEGAGGGVRDAGGARVEPQDAGGRAYESDTGGGRPHPHDLTRPIGGRRSDGPPFDYEQFYRDPGWTPEALAFEMQLGVHYFNDGPTLDAARSAVTRLRDVLTDLATVGMTDPAARQAIAGDVEAAFFRGDEDAFNSAGQVGHGVPLDALLRDGNLRELMTAFYNAAYFNRASPHTLAKAMLSVIDQGRWAEAQRAGVDVAELRGMRNQLDYSLNRAVMGRLEERFPPDQAPRFARDVFATANVIMRSDHPYRDLAEVVSSQAGRRTREEAEQLALATTAEHYERLGAPLGRYERAFVESIVGRLEPDTRLPWREGFVWHETGASAWAQRIGRDGYPVLDGVSATTTRMLTGAKLIGLRADGEHFLHALIGWMLPARDHSLFELLRGASIAGVEPVIIRPKSARPTAIDLYRNLPGIDLHTIRSQIAPDGLLPHEARYAAHAGDPHGFSETQHQVHEIADRLWPQLQTGRVADPDLVQWLERNDIDPRDPAAVRELADRLTNPHVVALSVYTQHSHSLINNAITVQMLTHGVSESAVRSAVDSNIGKLVDNYLATLAGGDNPMPLPLALRSVLHDGPGYLDSTSPLRPAARAWIDATQAVLAADAELNRLRAEGDSTGARAALIEKKNAMHAADLARIQIETELQAVAPRLFDEVRWHADMAYDALMQLPTVGSPEKPVIAYRGDWTTPGWSPIYGNKVLPFGKAYSVLSVSRLPEVALRFMEDNPANGHKVLAVYRLTGVNARDISVFSAFPGEQEAVLPPGSRTRQVRDPELEQQVRGQLPPAWRDRCRIIVLAERD